MVMEVLFWLCLVLVVYTYVGYGMVLCLLVSIKKKLAHQADNTMDEQREWPEVTLLICAYNEEEVVEMKMDNTRRLDYPQGKLKVMWVTDGSNDHTNDKLSTYEEVTVVYCPERQGKTAALNHGISECTTELVIMTDANTQLNSQAIKEMVKPFNDPKVSCVAGEKRVMAREESQTAAQGEGAYWKYESQLKKWDDALYSAMGCAGELCAIRKALYEPMAKDTLLDDFEMSMKTLMKGYRIAYTSDAYAMEYGSANIEEESKRKKRIAAGGLQSIWRLRALLNPFAHPIVAFQFVSHRVLRWSITPIALLALIPINVWLVFNKAGIIYHIIWVMQLLFYLAAFLGYLLDKRGRKISILYIPYYFLFMNINVFKGMGYLMQHRNNGAWEKAKRG